MPAVFAYRYQPAAWMRLVGEDAGDFAQSQFTNDLRPMARGTCRYGLWLDVKGKATADSFVLCFGDEDWRVFSYESPGEAIAEKLERHVVADEVACEPGAPVDAASIYGDGAASILEALGFAVPEPGAFAAAGEWLVFRGRRTRGDCFEVVAADSGEATSLDDRLEALRADGGLGVVGGEALERERIAAGIPRVPADIGPGDLPAEGGLEDVALSFTKGCFLGQEVAARMHHLGKPQRGLYRVSGQEGAPPPAGPLEREDGKKAGELRTAVAADPGWVGLALLKHRQVETGSVLRSGERRVSVETPVDG